MEDLSQKAPLCLSHPETSDSNQSNQEYFLLLLLLLMILMMHTLTFDFDFYFNDFDDAHTWDYL